MSETVFAHGSLEFGVLGPFEATRARGASLPLAGRQQRAILALLVCEAGHAVSVERMVATLWGDSAPAGALTSLQTYVFHLRQVLEPDRPRGSPGAILVTVPGATGWTSTRSVVDMTRFEEQVGHGRRGAGLVASPTRASGGVRGGTGAVAGGCAGRPCGLRVRGSRPGPPPGAAGIRASVAHPRPSSSSDTTLAVVAELGDTHRRPSASRGVPCPAASSRSTGRVDSRMPWPAYRELRALLNAELGIEPSPPLRELNARVLAQDPTLGWQPVPRSRSPVRARPVRRRDADRGRGGERFAQGPPPHPGWRPGGGCASAIAVLAGGATSVAGATLRHGPGRPCPPNAVSELDGAGAVVASVPVGTNPVALVPSRRRALGGQRR